MAIQQTTARLLAAALQERIRSRAVRFGLLARNLPPFDAATLCDELEPALAHGELRLALIGFTGVDALRGTEVATNVERALAWRNDPNIAVPLVVVLNPQQVQEKVHSLELFDAFEDADLHRAICMQGMKSSDHRCRLLWEVLRRSDMLQSIPLVAVQTAAYYDALQRHEPYGEALPHLGLLPDPALARHALERSTLIRRLKENRRYVQYVLSLDKKDYRALSSAFENDNKDRYRHTFLCIQAYMQYPAIDNLKRLTFDDVKELFNSLGILVDPSARANQPTLDGHASKGQLASLDDYIVARLLVGNPEQRQSVAALAHHENQRFREDPAGDGCAPPVTPVQRNHPGEGMMPIIFNGREIAFQHPQEKKERHPLEAAMRLWVQVNHWGGVTRGIRPGDSEAPLSELLENATALQFIPFQPVAIGSNSERGGPGRLTVLFKELESAIDRSESGEDSLVELFSALYNYRVELAAYRTLFLYRPVTATADPRLFSVLGDYLRTYEHLLNRLQRIYPRAEEQYPETIGEATSLFLALDTVIFDRSPGEAVILTTLHPLHLWKWLELAQRIRSNAETLNRDEQMAIMESSRHLPTSLITFLLHPKMLGDSRRLATWLVLAGEIRNPLAEGSVGVPYYEPTARHSGVLEGLDQLPRLLLNFLALYPPARTGLVMVLIDPPALAPILNALADLRLHEHDERPLLQGVRIDIYRTDPGAMAYDVWSQDDSEALSLFRTDPHWTFHIDAVHTNYADICARVEKSGPYHIILLCNPSIDGVQSVPRAFQGRPSPFSVPVQVSYDAIADRTRFVQAAGDGVFESYTKVRDALGGGLHRRTIGLESRCALTEQFLQMLSRASQWLIVTDRPHSTPEALASAGQCLMWHSSCSHTLSVYTKDLFRIRRHLADHLRSISVRCSPDFIEQYLQEALTLYPDGLLSTVSTPPGSEYEATHEALRPSSMRGLLDAIALLHWYRRSNPEVVLLNIALDQFSGWFDPERKPLPASLGYLMALWCQGDILYADVIAVHSGEEPPSISEAKLQMDWLEGFARTLEALFTPRADDALLAPIRRELLREKLRAAAFSAPSHHFPLEERSRQTRVKSGWARVVNNLFTSYAPSIRLRGAWMALHHAGEARVQSLGASSYRRDLVTLTGRILLATAQEASLPVEAIPPTHPASSSPLLRTLSAVQPLSTRTTGQVEDPGRDLPHVDSVHLNDDLREEVNRWAERLYRALDDYGIAVDEIDTGRTQVGPSILRYWVKLKPPAGRLAEVQKYAADLACEMGSTSGTLVENIPGQPYISIDLARERPETIPLAPVLAALPETQPRKMLIAVGQDPAGNDVQLDLAHLPHMLVTGTHSSEIRAFFAGLIASLARRHTATTLKLLLIGTGQGNLTSFERLPHLHGGRVLYEPSEAFAALQAFIVPEMDYRKSLLYKTKCPNILEYNRRNPGGELPYTVVVIDELADLMLSFPPDGRQAFERQIERLAIARPSLGIHLVLSTLYPIEDVFTASIKAAMKTRISFQLPSVWASRAILERSGAEYLLGRSDMFVWQKGEIQRLQGYSVPDGDWINLLQE